MKRQNNTLCMVWLALAVIIAVLILIFGAWHHLFTFGICVCMYLAFKGEEPPRKKGMIELRKREDVTE